jgi:hypothetical protein
MALQYRFVPLEHWPGPRTTRPEPAKFSAPWSKTLDLLERELRHLQAREIVLQADVQRGQIRNDGMLYAQAIPRSPGVIVSFNSKHGALSYPSDRFHKWQDNVRAIALALEALRAVDRYGVTKRAEQYKGWQALPAPDGGFDYESAGRFILSILGLKAHGPIVGGGWADRCRQAELITHPDRGGNVADFKRVQLARSVLLSS